MIHTKHIKIKNVFFKNLEFEIFQIPACSKSYFRKIKKAILEIFNILDMNVSLGSLMVRTDLLPRSSSGSIPFHDIFLIFFLILFYYINNKRKWMLFHAFFFIFISKSECLYEKGICCKQTLCIYH